MAYFGGEELVLFFFHRRLAFHLGLSKHILIYSVVTCTVSNLYRFSLGPDLPPEAFTTLDSHSDTAAASL